MHRTPLPAVLGGDPVVGPADQPTWPPRGPVDEGMAVEIVRGGQSFGYVDKPGPWRDALEQTVAGMTGDRYGVAQPNGTMGIEAGLRAQFLAQPPGWAAGRDRVLVADLTHASAHYGVQAAVATALGRPVRLVPIDARPDATMDADIVADHLARDGQRVLAVVPATMYGSFGAVGQIVSLCHAYGIPVHHDNALGGGALLEGEHAPTSSISGQGEGKAVPGSEVGITLTSHAELAALLRADGDCGSGPGRLDHIPHRPFDPPLRAGNRRVGELAAGQWLMQWMRALHTRLVARENRRLVANLLADVLPGLLWTPSPDAEFPPYFAWYGLATNELRKQVGLTGRDLRVALGAEGLRAERGFTPTHLDPAWRGCVEGLGMDYPTSARVYENAVFIPTQQLQDPRFPAWMADALRKVVDHAPALRGIGERHPEPCW